MTRHTRIFLIICLAAFVTSFLIQTVFQFLGAEKSVWGGNSGWQREIAFWNIGAAIVTAMTLRLNEERAGLAVSTGFTVLFLLLGTNHLFAVVADPHAQFHWPPLILNYIGSFFGLKVIFGSGRASKVVSPKDVA